MLAKWLSRHVLVACSGARGVEGNSAEVCEQVLNSKQDKLVCFQSVIQLAVKYRRFVFWNVCFVEISVTSQQGETLWHSTAPRQHLNCAFELKSAKSVGTACLLAYRHSCCRSGSKSKASAESTYISHFFLHLLLQATHHPQHCEVKVSKIRT